MSRDLLHPFSIGALVVGLSMATGAVVGILSVLDSLSSDAVAQQVASTKLSLVWSSSLPGIPQFCSGAEPAVVYMEYDPARKTTSIFKSTLRGEEKLLAEVPGNADVRSLSCSQDGRTIVAYDSDPPMLFLLRDSQLATYRLSGYRPFARAGLYSFLSPDGQSIKLPEKPVLVSGPDLMADISVFPDERHTVFFMEGHVYVDDAIGIQKYVPADGGWTKAGHEIKLPKDFSSTEIVRCGDHEVASLVGVETSRYMVLGDRSSPQDWLADIGVRRLFRRYNEPFLISGDYGTCAFPLLDRKHWHTTLGIARIERAGVRTFSLPYPEFRIANDNLSFSKDGCYLLLQGTWSGGVVSGNTHLLAVQSPECKR
ncbi:hypothetical protein [Bradyrhizobium sp. SZCCHNS30591]|uniref:hypothetical protein n=2 Tax=Bradyrhizobium TaxID=374 RepID=UPI0029160C39|nr:hypothetical protein [Bradyrhizobium sp. SZCCHNS30591]